MRGRPDEKKGLTKLVVDFGQLLLDGEFNPPPSPPFVMLANSLVMLAVSLTPPPAFVTPRSELITCCFGSTFAGTIGFWGTVKAG
jgi:hypothetical protein